jgi:hypothetical protein
MAERTELPIERLGNAITKAVNPLLITLQGLTRVVAVLTARLSPGDTSILESASSIEHDDDEKMVADSPEMFPVTKPADDFDMESAIKASKQWECEGAQHEERDPKTGAVSSRQLKCTDCSLEQNLDCISTYKLLEAADRATGKTDGSDEQARLALHAMLRPQGTPPAPVKVEPDAYTAGIMSKVVPVERLTAARPRVVPRLPQLDPAAQAALAKAGENAKTLSTGRLRVVPTDGPAAPAAKAPRKMSAETKAKVAAGLAKARAAKAAKNAPAKLKVSVADRMKAKAKLAKTSKKVVKKGSKR